MKKIVALLLWVFALTVGLNTTDVFAQFSGGLQGTVKDASGATIGGAVVTLTNLETQFSQKAKADSGGAYRFTSLAPGKYKVIAESPNFNPVETLFTLSTNETQSIPLTMAVGKVSSSVTVTSQAPLLDTADSRNQLTLEKQALEDLPLAARNPLALLTLTPGVTGLGAGTGTNFNPENYVDASANGRGQNGNQYIVDGMDVTSSIRPGVVNLTPNVDSVQEVSVQTNVYTVDYGRASSIQTVLTTKSGTSQYHGFASEYYTYQGLTARGEFGIPQPTRLAPYHVNNMSFGVGGPVIPHHEFFFFASLEPYLALNSNGGSLVTFEDPAFLTFAQQVQPNTPETALLAKYKPSGATFRSVLQNASQAFGAQNTAANTGCGTPSTDNIPCGTAIFDQGNFNSVSSNRSKQYNIRADKYFSKDRAYANFYRDTIVTNAPAVRPQFPSTGNDYTFSIQGNETHTFSSNLLNEAIVGYNRVEGIINQTGAIDNTVPIVNVTGLGVGFGDGFADGDFIQHAYHWRDALSYIHGKHSIRVGYEGWHGDDIALFAPPATIPAFQFNSMSDLINNNPYSESNLSYDPLTGLPKGHNYGFAQTTGGAFAEDSWRATQRLTVNYGIRYDNFGNAYPTLPGTVLANFHLADATGFQNQIAGGALTVQSHTFPGSLNYVFSPRAGFALDPTGSAKWVIRGGVGIFHDYFTLGNSENGLSANPPSIAFPTFFQTGTAGKPSFGYGTSATPPYGFTYPTFQATPLNNKGGIVGQQLNIGAVAADLKSPLTVNYSLAVERQIKSDLTVSLGYVGSHSDNLVTNGGNVSSTSYGYDVNAFAGDLLQHPAFNSSGAYTGTGTQTRLNTSFGAINYAFNGPHQNYYGIIAAVNGRFSKRGFLTASYTRSNTKDNWENYPTALNLDQYYANGPNDVPNRFSAGYSYDLPGFRDGHGLLGRATSGFVLAGTTVLQSCTPFTVYTNAPLLLDKAGKDGTVINSSNYASQLANGNLQFAPTSGDFNADGDNYDYPNVISYKQSHSRASYKQGVFGTCNSGVYSCGQFAQPAVGTEGVETPNQFRNPGYADTDLTIKKVTPIKEGVNLELRFDTFNVFNRVNLTVVDGNLQDGTFGTTSNTLAPRNMLLGARLNF